MRLTTTKKKEPELFVNLDSIDENQYFLKIADNDKVDDFSKIADKLGQLEDIEEELGIDLITLFKALKDGYWYKEDNEIIFEEPNGEGLREMLCGYGKTWALTKEELEL